MKIKCSFCDATTTKGYGEASGFGHWKGTVNGKIIDISACPKHADKSAEKFEEWLKSLGQS